MGVLVCGSASVMKYIQYVCVIIKTMIDSFDYHVNYEDTHIATECSLQYYLLILVSMLLFCLHSLSHQSEIKAVSLLVVMFR